MTTDIDVSDGSDGDEKNGDGRAEGRIRAQTLTKNFFSFIRSRPLPSTRTTPKHFIYRYRVYITSLWVVYHAFRCISRQFSLISLPFNRNHLERFTHRSESILGGGGCNRAIVTFLLLHSFSHSLPFISSLTHHIHSSSRSHRHPLRHFVSHHHRLSFITFVLVIGQLSLGSLTNLLRKAHA